MAPLFSSKETFRRLCAGFRNAAEQEKQKLPGKRKDSSIFFPSLSAMSHLFSLVLAYRKQLQKKEYYNTINHSKPCSGFRVPRAHEPSPERPREAWNGHFSPTPTGQKPAAAQVAELFQVSAIVLPPHTVISGGGHLLSTVILLTRKNPNKTQPNQPPNPPLPPLVYHFLFPPSHQACPPSQLPSLPPLHPGEGCCSG